VLARLEGSVVHRNQRSCATKGVDGEMDRLEGGSWERRQRGDGE
jgi:hypothetical protein